MFQERKGRRWRRWLIVSALLLIVALAGQVAWLLLWPDVSRLKAERPAKTAFMAYREAEWEKRGLKRRIDQRWVPLEAISPYALKAVIIAEDDKFWSHEGFDFAAIQKAIEKDLKQKKLKAGGSTISQQLAKNLYLTPAKSPIRKLKEAILTWRLERTLTKRRIIELYLNVAEWGDGIFGIEAASRHYFGKGAGELTAREAAGLAVVLPSPLKMRPGGGGPYVESRTEAIVSIMVRRGIVIPDYDALIEEGRKGSEGTDTSQVIAGPAGEKPLPETDREAPSSPAVAESP